jgi:type II secretory pathway pseudopilin PulG
MAAMLKQPGVTLRGRGGFTFVESLLSLVLITLAASVVGSIYYTGLQTHRVQAESVLLHSALRSRMEQLISLNFDQLQSGSQSLSIHGVNRTVTWTVAYVDMNGDGELDETAKELTVTLAGKTVVTLVVDSAGQVSKVS